jgi:alpha-glucoside transport system permease protein
MTAVAAPRSQAADQRGWFARVREHIGLHTAIIALMVIWAIPTVALFLNSVRPGDVASSSGWWTTFFPPYTFTFENYSHVLGGLNVGTYFLNSLFISIPATVIPLFVAAFAAYAFSWMEFPGRNVLFVVVVGLLVVPLQATLIPILKLFAEWGIAGTFLAVWLAHTGYGLPFAVYLLRNYMGSLPREVFESAAIDGASPVTAFFRLAIPMSVPVLAALAIFQFLFVWNDLLVALVYLSVVNPDNNPLPVYLTGLVNSIGGGTQFLGAAAFLSMLLPLIVFFSLHRYFVRGIVGGSVKG